ncbi:MAG: HAD family hydrolase [Pseudomonadota bacterium]
MPTKSAQATIVFDLDDTLLATAPLYDAVLDRFSSLVAQYLGCDQTLVRELQEEIDIKAVEEVGFSKDRFPWSLAETYRVLAARLGVVASATVADELCRLGLSTLETVPDMIPGARSLLEELRPSFELLLYTLGAPEIQRRKIEHHALDRLFDEIHVVGDKTVDELRRVLGGRQPQRVMVVGDSLRGEIGPAVKTGCRAVLVRRHQPWRYLLAEVPGHYETVDDVAAVVPLARTWVEQLAP